MTLINLILEYISSMLSGGMLILKHLLYTIKNHLESLSLQCDGKTGIKEDNIIHSISELAFIPFKGKKDYWLCQHLSLCLTQWFNVGQQSTLMKKHKVQLLYIAICIRSFLVTLKYVTWLPCHRIHPSWLLYKVDLHIVPVLSCFVRMTNVT